MTILETLQYQGKKAEIYKDSHGDFRFRIKARNGEIVVASEPYANKGNAKRAAKRLLGIV